MAVSMPKIGLNTQKISFGKSGWGCDDKDFSSSCSRRSSYSSDYARPAKSEPVRESKITRTELLDKLNQYADDPVMVRIITQQLRNLD